MPLTIVQSATGATSATFPNPVTEGNVIYAIIIGKGSHWSTAPVTFSPSDSQGNTYQSAGPASGTVRGEQNTNAASFSACVLQNAACTVSAGFGSSSLDSSLIEIYEISGVRGQVFPFQQMIDVDSDAPLSTSITLTPLSDPGSQCPAKCTGKILYFGYSAGDLEPTGAPLSTAHRMDADDTGSFTFSWSTVTGSITSSLAVAFAEGVPQTCPFLNCGTCATTATVGVPYSCLMSYRGQNGFFPFGITAGSLPPGLFMDNSIAQISGTPTTPGTYPFTVRMQGVLNGHGITLFTDCSITVAGSALSLSCGTCNSGGEAGAPYSCQLTASNGTAPYVFAITAGSLPPGLSLNTSTGAISGTPLSGGSFGFTAQVTDSLAATASADCSIAIIGGVGLTCSTCDNPATVGVAYSCGLIATGGTPPYIFTVVDGSLPPGLGLDPNYGVIFGTPTTAGNYSFTIRVTDSLGSTADATCGIEVSVPPCVDMLSGEGLEEIQPSILPSG